MPPQQNNASCSECPSREDNQYPNHHTPTKEKLKKKTSNDNLNNNSCHLCSTCTTTPSVVTFPHAPPYLKFNPFITSGYRKNVSQFQTCLHSAFTWTNETVNIWTHFLGWLVFLYLTVKELVSWGDHKTWEEFLVKVGVLICFQACMLLSASYHTFCCTSDASYRRWLTADLFGVSMSLLGIYLSGIYFAFKCDGFWLNFYTLTVLAIFLLAISAQFRGGDHSCEEGFHWRLLLFGAWAAYGILPTLQWVWMRTENVDFINLLKWGSGGGDGGELDWEVKHLLPRIVTMYILSTVAFFFYISRFPERLLPGRFNYILSSHNLWHVLIFIALYYWHTSVVVDHFATTGNTGCGIANS